MSPWFIEAVEAWLRLRNRLKGVGYHPDPWKHFGPGGVEEAEARCAEANQDFLSFVRPPQDVAAEPLETLADRRSRRGRVTSYRFPSPAPSGAPANDQVGFRVYRPRRDAAPGRVLVFHHPIYQDRWMLWEWFLDPLIRRYTVAMMEGPYHFSRVPPGEYPGESVCNPNPWKLFLAMRQWCWDQAALTRALETRLGLRPALTLGFSIGAFQSILAAAAGALDGPLVSLASTNRYAYGVTRGVIGRGIFEGMQAVGIDAARLARMTEAIQLERFASRIRGRAVLYVYGERDRVDPPPSLERLQWALRPTRTLRLPVGHGTLVFCRRAIGRAVLQFAREHAGLTDPSEAAAKEAAAS